MENMNFTTNITKIKMKNGVTLLLENLPYFKSVTLGFFLRKGSRDENDNRRGYAHFCEHMLFKGTSKYNKESIAEIFDRMGGYINAYTTNEAVAVYNKVPYFNLDGVLELIYKIYSDSLFEKSELESEREVILNEINSTLEDPQDKIGEDFMFNLFPKQGLGYPIIGTTESIESATRDDLYSFYKTAFNSKDLIIAISGNINVDNIIKKVEKFDFASSNIENDKVAIQGEEKSFFTELNSEQLHIMGGTSKFTLTKDTYLHSNILNNILGETMSSRLFQKIREEMGLCYSIYSFIHKYRKENVFGIYTSVMPKSAKKTVDAISGVLRILIKEGITKEELEKAKEQQIGEIILNSDIIQKRMQRMVGQEIRFGEQYDENYTISKINNITVEDINKLIKEVFIRENFVTQGLYRKKMELGEWDF